MRRHHEYGVTGAAAASWFQSKEPSVASHDGRTVAPPKPSTVLVATSYTMPIALRAGGDTGGNCCVHVVPSQVQVSLRYVPAGIKLLWPPKSTILPAAPSYAIPAPKRGDGEVAGDSCNHPPRQFQVSPYVVPELAPPKSTVDLVAKSYAMPILVRADGVPLSTSTQFTVWASIVPSVITAAVTSDACKIVLRENI
jgi:hypothetical protein